MYSFTARASAALRGLVTNQRGMCNWLNVQAETLACPIVSGATIAMVSATVAKNNPVPKMLASNVREVLWLDAERDRMARSHVRTPDTRMVRAGDATYVTGSHYTGGATWLKVA